MALSLSRCLARAQALRRMAMLSSIAPYTRATPCSAAAMSVSSPLVMLTRPHTRSLSSSSTAAPVRCIGQPLPETHPHLMRPGELTPGIMASEYAHRREVLVGSLPRNSVAVLFAGVETYMSNDIPYPYRQHTDFLYMTGFQEPAAAAVFTNLNGRQSYRLFVRPRDPYREMWDGPRCGTDGLVHFGSEEPASSTIDALQAYLAGIINGAEHIFADESGASIVFQLCPSAADKGYKNLTAVVERMRLTKSEAEVALAAKAAAISAEAFIETMRRTRSNIAEHVLSSVIEHECKLRGAQRLAYPPVVAGGARANTLHYISNDHIVRDGDLVLMDAGCEYNNLSSDITRTWPANGRFSPPQRAVYEAVLHVQLQMLERCRIGTSIVELHHESLKLTREAVLKYELLDREHLSRTGASVDNIITKIYPHNIGHYLGMDVHDTISCNGSIKLDHGMYITIEPGLYLPDAPFIKPQYRNIGVRIEDDVLITSNGPRVLTDGAPKRLADIEHLMQGAQ